MKQITLKQIAQRAGFSVGTVDRALNNRGRISPQTKERILQIADEMGYQPNRIASALSRSKSPRIAVLYPKFPGYFVDKMTAGLTMAMEYLSNYKIEVVPLRCDHLSPASQISVIEQTDFSGFDGFCLNASSEALTPYLDRIVDMGIPVATFNSDIYNSKRLFHVGMDPFMAGQVSCDLIAKILHGHGKVLVIPGYYSVLSHKERLDGFLDIVRQYPDIEIIQNGEYRDQEDLAQDLVRQVMEKHPDLRGIYTVSSPGTIGAGYYLRTLPPEQRPILCGYDTNESILHLMNEDICSFVIYQNPTAQIYYAVRYMVDYLLFGNLPEKESSFLPPQIVVKENIHYYLHMDDKFTLLN